MNARNNSKKEFNSQQPWLSIVVPNLNQAKFISDLMESIIHQQGPSWEIIFMDGGSTDGSLELVEKYKEHIAVLRSGPDGGQAAAINQGLSLSKGQWVCWQNSDDLFLPGAFRAAYQASLRHPEAHVIFGNMQLIDQNGHKIREQRYVPATLNSLLSEGMVITNQSTFWRREIHDEIGFMDETLTCAFDYDWFLRLANSRKMVHVNEIWGNLRIHEDTKSHRLKTLFEQETSLVRSRWKRPLFPRFFYLFRRFVISLCNGNRGYVWNGLLRRLGI